MIRQKPTLAICITSLGARQSELKKMPDVIASLGTYFRVLSIQDISANDIFDSQPAGSRITSLNKALETADIAMAFNGGYNSIELFSRFEEVETNPVKIFVGYSDNTLLANALPATQRARGWQGPMLSSFIKNPQWVDVWSENLCAWYTGDDTQVTQQYNQLGMRVFRAGTMQGKIWGGNNYTFDLLQGTPFCPLLNEPFIFLLEGEDFIMDKKRVWQDTIRNLDSVMLLPSARNNLQGLLIGRYPSSYTLDEQELSASIKKRDYLQDIPIIYDFPRGYGVPALTLPLGEELILEARKDNTINISIV